ncbi:MAG: hypothetical protein H7A35_04550 [Planctomycetales bacterium]|nr:hypothetical protein [bacterium]UNM09328.1 MAG: hypothetical protein H7A35_04550 [Planctomycetales bacterium]
MEAKKNINGNDNKQNNGVIIVIRNLMALVVMLALGLLASCGGGSSAMADLDAPADDAKAVDYTMAPSLDEVVADREASSSWYVATSDAAYIDGIDYLYQLLTDGNGKYQFVMKVTNNSSQARHITYNSTKRADFSIVKNGQELYRWSEGRFFGFVFETRTLSPYQTFEYKADWNGRDRHGNPISGNVMANGFHTSVSNPASLGQVAYLNGKVSN